ncbi:MAG TPA: hypothetical protein QF800_03620 [Phycisphaerales bacterium]|nr:hypothetical protein [Phycisphaerales bacterium]
MCHQKPTEETSMLDWVNQWKRPLMGWVGLGGIVAALLITSADPMMRFVAATISIALLVLAMPRRIWTQWRTWWRD